MVFLSYFHQIKFQIIESKIIENERHLLKIKDIIYDIQSHIKSYFISNSADEKKAF